MLTSALYSLSFFKVDLAVLVPADQTADDQTASRSSYSPDSRECSHSEVVFILLLSLSPVCTFSYLFATLLGFKTSGIGVEMITTYFEIGIVKVDARGKDIK